MLIVWIDRLLAAWPSLPLVQGLDKITLRALVAAAFSFALAVLTGPRLIRWLERRFREPIKGASAAVNQLHGAKANTPTMGGLFIVAGLLVATLGCGDLENTYVLAAVWLIAGLGIVGAGDDLVKLRTSARGLSPRAKLAAQTAVAVGAALMVYHGHAQQPDGLLLSVPALGTFDLGWWFVPLAVLVIVSSSNAVNLADGLDGLAAGCLLSATLAIGLTVYAAGHAHWAEYLGIAHIAGGGEMVVILGGMLGALLGFLWFNCHPASVFMGDTGSLPLGGLLGLVATVARQELVFVFVAGVFVVEALSVIVQVASYRWRKKRVLLCAPLHHHFQLRGWPEGKIVVRFWIAGALCAAAGLAGLKLQGTPEPAPQVATVSQVTR